MNVAEGFFFGEYEVTDSQYLAYARAVAVAESARPVARPELKRRLRDVVAQWEIRAQKRPGLGEPRHRSVVGRGDGVFAAGRPRE